MEAAFQETKQVLHDPKLPYGTLMLTPSKLSVIGPPDETSTANNQLVKVRVKMITPTELVVSVALVLAVAVVPRDLVVAVIVTAVPASRKHCPLMMTTCCI